MTYSLDLREKVIAAYDSGILTQVEISEVLEISLSTVKRYLKQYRDTGILAPKTDNMTGRPKLIDEQGLETLEALIKTNPSITLAGLAEKYYQKHHRKVGRSVLSRACIKLNLRRKKLSQFAQEREREDVKKKDKNI